jgi:hypothetical protein
MCDIKQVDRSEEGDAGPLFVFLVSNFHLCVINLQPSGESFDVWSAPLLDGVSSLDFGPASGGAFFVPFTVQPLTDSMCEIEGRATPRLFGCSIRATSTRSFRKKVMILSNDPPCALI